MRCLIARFHVVAVYAALAQVWNWHFSAVETAMPNVGDWVNSGHYAYDSETTFLTHTSHRLAQ